MSIIERIENEKIPHTVLETPTLFFSSYKNCELNIKSKTVVSRNSQKKKEGIFCTVYFVRSKFFNICVLSQFKMYILLNIYTFIFYIYFYKIIYTLLLLVSKIVESIQGIFKSNLQQLKINSIK